MSIITLNTQHHSVHRFRSATLPSGNQDATECSKLLVDDTVENNNADLKEESQSVLGSMQLVEPWKHVPVPNHLLETKIFSNRSENDLVCAIPAYIQFAGFQPGKVFCRRLELLNKSGDVQRFHIIPPQTKYFGIKYRKDRRLVPGMSVSCIVEFYPDESRYFYDCIKVHCEGDDNLIIPVHAFPVLDLSEFPKTMDFSAVAIGQSKSKSFRLRSKAPMCFNFQLTCVDGSPAFTVEPMCGNVPANEEVTVHVTFRPTAFVTAMMYIRLDVNQFIDFDPLFCNVTGHSYPGLTAQKELARSVSLKTSGDFKEEQDTQPVLDDETAAGPQDGINTSTAEPVCITPLELARSRKKALLSQRSGRKHSKEIKKYPAVEQPVLTRQMKESMFEAARKEKLNDERKNQLRWQTKLGADPVTTEYCAQVMRERKSATPSDKDFEGKSTRTTRNACQSIQCCASFDVYENNIWNKRQRTLERFRHAASKIIIRQRMNSRLSNILHFLNRFSSNSNQQGFTSEDSEDISCSTLMMTAEKVLDRAFPLEPKPPEADVADALALGPVPTLPNEIKLQEHINYFPLKVCPQYQLLGYKRHCVQEASQSYVPRGLLRRLRTGAEDELVSVDMDPITQHSSQELPKRITEGLIQQTEPEKADQVQAQSEVQLLVPPCGLYEPIRYHPLHIFNAVPGLQTYQTPLPYSEVDPDYHLCPLPRFPALSSFDQLHKSTQKHFLDREEVISRVMSWKKFPSPTIAACANTPSLVNIWVPQWSDPYNDDILPLDGPGLQCCLFEEDRMNISESRPVSCQPLTSEMVRREFEAISTELHPSASSSEQTRKPVETDDRHLPASNVPFGSRGHISRQEREDHLVKYLRNKRHTLRQKLELHLDECLSIQNKAEY